MFKRVLVANRGEIAIRILRTLREMKIGGVAVYSEVDAGAAHVRAADHAVCIGPAAPSASYLNVERVIDAAKQSGADAVIPGYGFLSEHAGFAQACRDAGLCFVGPEPRVIDTMGDKLLARRVAEEAGVPLLPGAYVTSAEEARMRADAIGYPVLLKAAAGGGGKGMRRLDDPSQLASAFDGAKREAERAFGDGRLYVERALERSRHVEVQVIGDQHGNLAHVFERDCSIQRRHQKVVEETPSPHLPPALLARMTHAALELCKAVEYTSVGTVEFLVGGADEFYFLEMNTRLQVEHTVTELVTGLDLVREMLSIAAGRPLSRTQAALVRRGVALQCRLYAEDPNAGFLPRTGRIELLRLAAGPFVRVDAGVLQGSVVGSDYDPLLAKLCTWGEDREQAIARMQRALAETRVDGVQTNLGLLRALMNDPDFITGSYDTSFLTTRRDAAVGPDGKLLAALGAVGFRHRRREEDVLVSSRTSNWARSGRPR